MVISCIMMVFKLPTFNYSLITRKQILCLSVVFIKHTLHFSDEFNEVDAYMIITQGDQFGKAIL